MRLRRHVLSAALASAALLGMTMHSLSAQADMPRNVVWADFSSAWTPFSTSGSVAWEGGLIDVSITAIQPTLPIFNTRGRTGQTLVGDTTDTFDSLYVSHILSPASWRAEFDLTGTSLTGDRIFSVGQLFSESVSNTSLVEIDFFAGQTAVDRSDLTVSYSSLDRPNFDQPLDWDPATGVLKPDTSGGPVSNTNSHFAEFTNSGTQAIDSIVVTFESGLFELPDALEFAFGAPAGGPGDTSNPVPEPASWAMMLLGFGLAGLRLSLRSRKRAH